ncbi:MAG TPA: isoaspartyl peptidase/L-asparaginase [Candidatus Binataceae bacterium]|nr:isoaspartyl peptidase/L-asparaginase [Candidatus Binataceae bacterium]
MPKPIIKPMLIAHGGAGGRAPVSERVERQRGLIDAVERGSTVLRNGGNALDAVTNTVAALEDHALFNAGYGSVLTLEGRVEMDAGVVMAERQTLRSPGAERRRRSTGIIRAGGVVLVTRVHNPVLLARLVMERTPHVLIGGVAAERLAREAGIPLCRPEQLVTKRARERWLAVLQAAPRRTESHHGTVGAAALDSAGNLAAATSTGGVSGKLPGRIGDSAIIGAGLYAALNGAASATGTGEAIMKVGLCREAVRLLPRMGPHAAAAHAIDELYAQTGGEAGVIMVDSSGRLGYAHNAQAMEIAFFNSRDIRHVVVDPIAKHPTHG